MFVSKNSETTSWHELLHHFGPFCSEFCKATKQSQMHPNSTKHKKNMNLESHGVDRVHSLQKIPTRIHGMNFCTSLARFAPSFITQPNGPQCTQIEQNPPKISLGSTGMDRVRSLRKIPTRLHGTNFCTSSARFPPSFVS